MNFMSDTDFLLLMCNCEGRWVGLGERQHILTISERARLREVGMRTAHEQPAWALIEPARGEYNWDYLDTIIHRNREAGLKTLMQLPGWNLPRWVPNEWRARQANGTYEAEVLSLWNEEAQEYSDDHIRTVMDHYRDDDVGFFYGEFQGGEGMYPSTWPLYDHAALEDFQEKVESSRPDPNDRYTLDWFGTACINQFVRKNTLLREKHREIWNCQQRLMDTWTKSFGNFVQEDILRVCRRLYPEDILVLCQCTYYDPSHDEANSKWVHHLTDTYKCETIVEAMFCTGLPTTTPKAIAEGFRGQIVHPVNELDKKALEDWEVNNIRDSYNKWLKHYEHQ